MGQRFQSVFILPSVYINEGNPNNRSEKVLVFHNQWLYGMSAININLSIMERLSKAIKKAIRNKQQYAFNEDMKKTIKKYHLETFLLNAIKWASVQDLNNETNFHEPEELIYSEEEKKPKEEQTGLKELLESQDNNNGFFICLIHDDLTLSYGFLNGFEDAKKIELQTPYSYLSLFYSDEKLKELRAYDYMQKQFKKFSKFKEIGRTRLKEVIDYLNENKPNWA